VVQVACAPPYPLWARETWEGRVLVYVGPKEYERLKVSAWGSKSQYISVVSRHRRSMVACRWNGLPCHSVLLSCSNRYTHNYGVAIILLTVLTKVLFFPLTLKSMRSMKAMQALQPQINSLRSKHKSDPQRVQRETMELYREHRVNPLGGCLPMVVQIPVFYALYVALSYPWRCRTRPSSASDDSSALTFGSATWRRTIPTYVLRSDGPLDADPAEDDADHGRSRQAKMMLIMPVVFTFMFLNLPRAWCSTGPCPMCSRSPSSSTWSAEARPQRTTGRVASKKA